LQSETNSWSILMRIGLIAKAVVIQILLTFCASHGWAASPCIAPPLSDQAIDKFKGDPQALVAPDSDTRTIEALVRDIAGTDATLAAALVRLAAATTPRFQTAIAAGLAQAAIACSNVDQGAALLIQQAVAGFNNGEFQNAFAAVAGDLSTAAVAAATSSANGSVGSVVVTNPNGSPGSSTNFGGGGTTQFVQIVSGGVANIAATAASTTPTTTTTAASPVSATH
jgi:hypothetical protein